MDEQLLPVVIDLDHLPFKELPAQNRIKGAVPVVDHHCTHARVQPADIHVVARAVVHRGDAV
ncbi:hypothetical protein D3C71_1725070 [compost metagenome]